MTRTQKLIGIVVLGALLVASFFLVEEYWLRFTAAFVVAAFARAIWVAPMR